MSRLSKQIVMKMNIQNLLRNEIMLKEREDKKLDARLGLWGAILVSDKLQNIGRSNTYIIGEAMPYDIWSEKLRIEVKTSLPAIKRGHYAGFSGIRPEFFDHLVLVRVHEDWGNPEF